MVQEDDELVVDNNNFSVNLQPRVNGAGGDGFASTSCDPTELNVTYFLGTEPQRASRR